MSADLLKLKESRLFRKLPERAFNKTLKYIKVKAFTKGESVQRLSGSAEVEHSHFGYVISGRVLFLGEGEKPLGIAAKDEFFLGKAFKIEDMAVKELVSASESTIVVYIPKEIIEILASTSDSYSEMIEDIYESIYERAKLMAADVKGAKHYQDWLASVDGTKTLTSWLGQLEKKRVAKLKQKEKDRVNAAFVRFLWFVGIVIFSLLAAESIGRKYQIESGFMYYLTGIIGEYDAGSDYNVAIGVIGYILIFMTNIHTFTKIAIRKFKWKIDYRRSVQLHVFMGVLGAGFVIFHSAGQLQGNNVAHFAIYALIGTILSGIVGQLISSQIPKTIQGEKVRLSALKEEGTKLKRKAELLMNNQQYKTSVELLSKPIKPSVWGNFLYAPRLWWRRRKVRRALKALGLGKESAQLGASLILKEYKLQQKIKNLEIANIFFKRWMLIHKPFAYGLYLFGTVHMLIETFLR